MAEGIKRFIECYVPVTCCNLKCDYCYVPQKHWKQGKMPKFKYSPERIGMAFSQERWGGVCYISICGGGETLLPPEMPQIVYEILKQGHYVNVTNNGTSTKAFSKILELIPSEMLCRLHFAFSLHYKELKRLNLLDVFSNNVKRVRSAGCSYVVQINLYDGYVPYLEEIKHYCIEHFGALPQVAATRDESELPHKFYTKLSNQEYIELGRQFESPLFDFTIKNFNKKRGEYCYAGAWTYVADIAEGWLKPCYCNGSMFDFMSDLDKVIPYDPVGHKCRSAFCTNSSHFLSLGAIPDIYQDVTYAYLRNRDCAGWYSEGMREFLSSKLQDQNRLFTNAEKFYFGVKIATKTFLRRCCNKAARILTGRNLLKTKFSDYSR